MQENLTIYTPGYRHRIGFFRSIWIIFRNAYNSRELIWQLFRRDFLMTYKRSFIGIGWIFISPIVGIISWVILNSTGILDPGDVGIPYPAYVLVSSTIWGLFPGVIGAASGTLGAGSGFINQVNYPHEVLYFKQLLQMLAGFVITFVLNLVILVLFGVPFSWGILLFPLMILPLLLLGSAIGLVLNLVSVVAPDISTIFNMGLGFVFYMTPVVYSIDVENETLRKIIMYNPLTYLVEGVRTMMLDGELAYADRFLTISAISLILFLISLRIFYVSEEKVVERML